MRVRECDDSISKFGKKIRWFKVQIDVMSLWGLLIRDRRPSDIEPIAGTEEGPRVLPPGTNTQLY